MTLQSWLRNAFGVLAAIIMCATLPAPSLGEDLRFVNEHWPPYIIVSSEDKMEGIDVDILQHLADRLSLNLTTKICPWVRCLKAIEDGHADIISAALKRPDREQYMRYIEPPYIERSVKLFYLRKGDGGRIQSFADLKNLTIGVLRGSAYFPQFDNDHSIRKVDVKTTERLLEMLRLKRVDAVIGTELVTDHIISSMAYEGLFDKSSYRIESQEPFYMAISRKSPHMKRIDEFDRAMQALVDEGIVARTIKKHVQ